MSIIGITEIVLLLNKAGFASATQVDIDKELMGDAKNKINNHVENRRRKWYDAPARNLIIVRYYLNVVDQTNKHYQIGDQKIRNIFLYSNFCV